MSSSEQEIQAPTFVPTTDNPPDAADQLAGIDASLETFPSAVDLVVTVRPPAPLGRSWSFSWPRRTFLRGNAATPMPTRETQTLYEWVEKCLRTARGAHPIHPPGYGMPGDPTDAVGQRVGWVPPDLYERVKSAMKFHPRIVDVVDFRYGFDPDDDYLMVQFTLELDDGSELPVDNLQVAL